jgi:hypothetical protein
MTAPREKSEGASSAHPRRCLAPAGCRVALSLSSSPSCPRLRLASTSSLRRCLAPVGCRVTLSLSSSPSRRRLRLASTSSLCRCLAPAGCGVALSLSRLVVVSVSSSSPSRRRLPFRQFDLGAQPCERIAALGLCCWNHVAQLPAPLGDGRFGHRISAPALPVAMTDE